MRAVSGGPWHLFTALRVLCVLCTVSVATWSLFTGVRIVCGTRVVLVASLAPPTLFFSFFFTLVFLRCCLFVAFLFFFNSEAKLKRTREHYRHRHGQLEQWCSSAVFLVVVCVAAVFLAVAHQGWARVS